MAPKTSLSPQAAGTESPYDQGHLTLAWLGILQQACASSQFAAITGQSKNPWVQKDAGLLLKKFIQSLPAQNILMHMANEFDAEDDFQVAEVIAHLRVCPQCAQNVIGLPA
jgi:hypothetical protein